MTLLCSWCLTLTATQDDVLKPLHGKARMCEDSVWNELKKVDAKSIMRAIEGSEGSTKDWYRSNLIHALAHMGTDEALTEVRKLADEQEWMVRAEAVRAMGHFDRPEVRKDLLSRLESEKDFSVLGSVMQALVRLQEKSAVKPLLEIVKAEGSTPAQLSALAALEHLGDSKVEKELATLYKSMKEDDEWIEWIRPALATTAAMLGAKDMETEIQRYFDKGTPSQRYRAADYFLSTGAIKGAAAYIDGMKGKDRRDACFRHDSFRRFIPDLPEAKIDTLALRDPDGGIIEGVEARSLSVEEGKRVSDWFEANKAKLVFDSKSKVFKLK